MLLTVARFPDPMIAKGYREDAIDNIAFCLIAGWKRFRTAKGVAELQKYCCQLPQDPEIISSIIDKAAANKLIYLLFKQLTLSG